MLGKSWHGLMHQHWCAWLWQPSMKYKTFLCAGGRCIETKRRQQFLFVSLLAKYNLDCPCLCHSQYPWTSPNCILNVWLEGPNSKGSTADEWRGPLFRLLRLCALHQNASILVAASQSSVLLLTWVHQLWYMIHMMLYMWERSNTHTHTNTHSPCSKSLHFLQFAMDTRSTGRWIWSYVLGFDKAIL